MNNTLLEIAIKEIDISTIDNAAAVLDMQKIAYQAEAEAAGVEELPYLEYSISALEKSENTFIGAYVDDQLAGVLSFWITDDQTMDIHLFMTQPKYQRQGVASTLLEHAKTSYPGLKKIIAQTGAENKPAIDFYKKHGIHFVCNIQVTPSFELATFLRNL